VFLKNIFDPQGPSEGALRALGANLFSRSIQFSRLSFYVKIVIIRILSLIQQKRRKLSSAFFKNSGSSSGAKRRHHDSLDGMKPVLSLIKYYRMF
jgi:hypothetical protein